MTSPTYDPTGLPVEPGPEQYDTLQTDLRLGGPSESGAFADSEYRPGDFPVTERAAEEILSLPLFPGITAEQQERVADVLRAAVGRDA